MNEPLNHTGYMIILSQDLMGYTGLYPFYNTFLLKSKMLATLQKFSSCL